MRAMLLAAGRGERMRPLTDVHPKPLLMAGGKPLIVWHLEKLAAAGFREVVINHAWLGEQLPATLGDGSRFGLRLHYSPESGDALETAGGIVQALPMLRTPDAPDAPFAVISSDVWSDADYARLPAIARQLRAADALCWCLMVPNPGHHRQGDFLLEGERLALREVPPGGLPALTYTGIGVYTAALFDGLRAGTRSPLRPWLEAAIRAGRALGHYHRGLWFDIGTPQRLAELDRRLRDS
ncbi:MAG: nucleotidyltransferase family protein [Lautropia sp.]|nr:nucleotidyltransferase family protein [Lautropia sp.]